MLLKKSRVKLSPDPRPHIAGDIFHVGEVECRVTGGGFWYEGPARKYSCTVYVALQEEAFEGDGDGEFSHELRIFVVPKGYNPDKVGLIYTDPGFEKDMQAFFKKLGMPAWSKVDGSEQGMQGNNYVDMEVWSKRAVNWVKKQTKKELVRG